MDPIFVGMDPTSPQNECPAVYVDPLTGDFLFQGRVVTDKQLLERINGNAPIGADEAIVWHPARMADTILKAINGVYGEGLDGPGHPDFRTLLSNTKRSAVHLEMRDTYDATEPGFLAWQSDRTLPPEKASEWGDWVELISGAVERGVVVRRARVVSEPVTDYIRWEHYLTEVNVQAGEQVRWLPRKKAFDLLLPGADFWIFDQRLVVFNFNAGDGHSLGIGAYEYVSDPRHVVQAVAAFETVWDRATPHESYQL
jgi:hypothetical protein